MEELSGGWLFRAPAGIAKGKKELMYSKMMHFFKGKYACRQGMERQRGGVYI